MLEHYGSALRFQAASENQEIMSTAGCEKPSRRLPDGLLVELNDASPLFSPVKTLNRLKYTCIAVSAKYVALGANSGGLYLFQRSSIWSYLKLIPNKDGALVSVAFSPNDNYIGICSEKQVAIWELNLDGREKPVRIKSTSGEHQSPITCLCWDTYGARLYSGDKNGVVTVTYMPPTKVSRRGNEACKNHAFRSDDLIYRSEGGVVQMDFKGVTLVVSTKKICYVLNTQLAQARQVGQKPKDGMFGGCLRHRIINGGKSELTLYTARPGARVWQASVTDLKVSTHKLKEALQEPQQSFHGIRYEPDFVPPAADLQSSALVFPSLQILAGRFLVAWSHTIFCVYDPDGDDNARLVHWCAFPQEINFVQCFSNEVYIMHNGLSQVKCVKLVKPDEAVSLLYHHPSMLKLQAVEVSCRYSNILKSGPCRRDVPLELLDNLLEFYRLQPEAVLLPALQKLRLDAEESTPGDEDEVDGGFSVLPSGIVSVIPSSRSSSARGGSPYSMSGESPSRSSSVSNMRPPYADSSNVSPLVSAASSLSNISSGMAQSSDSSPMTRCKDLTSSSNTSLADDAPAVSNLVNGSGDHFTTSTPAQRSSPALDMAELTNASDQAAVSVPPQVPLLDAPIEPLHPPASDDSAANGCIPTGDVLRSVSSFAPAAAEPGPVSPEADVSLPGSSQPALVETSTSNGSCKLASDLADTVEPADEMEVLLSNSGSGAVDTGNLVSETQDDVGSGSTPAVSCRGEEETEESTLQSPPEGVLQPAVSTSSIPDMEMIPAVAGITTVPCEGGSQAATHEDANDNIPHRESSPFQSRPVSTSPTIDALSSRPSASVGEASSPPHSPTLTSFAVGVESRSQPVPESTAQLEAVPFPEVELSAKRPKKKKPKKNGKKSRQPHVQADGSQTDDIFSSEDTSLVGSPGVAVVLPASAKDCREEQSPQTSVVPLLPSAVPDTCDPDNTAAMQPQRDPDNTAAMQPQRDPDNTAAMQPQRDPDNTAAMQPQRDPDNTAAMPPREPDTCDPDNTAAMPPREPDTRDSDNTAAMPPQEPESSLPAHAVTKEVDPEPTPATDETSGSPAQSLTKTVEDVEADIPCTAPAAEDAVLLLEPQFVTSHPELADGVDSGIRNVSTANLDPAVPDTTSLDVLSPPAPSDAAPSGNTVIDRPVTPPIPDQPNEQSSPPPLLHSAPRFQRRGGKPSPGKSQQQSSVQQVSSPPKHVGSDLLVVSHPGAAPTAQPVKTQPSIMQSLKSRGRSALDSQPSKQPSKAPYSKTASTKSADGSSGKSLFSRSTSQTSGKNQALKKMATRSSSLMEINVEDDADGDLVVSRSSGSKSKGKRRSKASITEIPAEEALTEPGPSFSDTSGIQSVNTSPPSRTSPSLTTESSDTFGDTSMEFFSSVASGGATPVAATAVVSNRSKSATDKAKSFLRNMSTEVSQRLASAGNRTTSAPLPVVAPAASRPDLEHAPSMAEPQRLPLVVDLCEEVVLTKRKLTLDAVCTRSMLIRCLVGLYKRFHELSLEFANFCGREGEMVDVQLSYAQVAAQSMTQQELSTTVEVFTLFASVGVDSAGLLDDNYDKPLSGGSEKCDSGLQLLWEIQPFLEMNKLKLLFHSRGWNRHHMAWHFFLKDHLLDKYVEEIKSHIRHGNSQAVVSALDSIATSCELSLLPCISHLYAIHGMPVVTACASLLSVVMPWEVAAMTCPAAFFTQSGEADMPSVNCCSKCRSQANEWPHLLHYISLVQEKDPNVFHSHILCDSGFLLLWLEAALHVRPDTSKLFSEDADNSLNASPGSHKLPFQHSAVIWQCLQALIDLSRPDLLLPALRLCREAGYWLGVLALLVQSDKRFEAIQLLVHLDDDRLLSHQQWPVCPDGDKEWRQLIDVFSSLEPRASFPHSLSWPVIISRMVLQCGSSVAMSVLQSLPHDKGEAFNPCHLSIVLSASRLEVQQQALGQAALEKVDMHLWSTQSCALAPGLQHEATTELTQLLALRGSDVDFDDKSGLTASSTVSPARPSHPGLGSLLHLKEPVRWLESASSHWGVTAPLASDDCSCCGLPLRDTMQESVKSIAVFPCGHAFHRYCIPEDVCLLCYGSGASSSLIT